MLKYSQCAACAHYRWGSSSVGGQCAAFPDGIPEEIYRNRVRHDRPYPGDNGIMFEKDPSWGAAGGDESFTPTGSAFER